MVRSALPDATVEGERPEMDGVGVAEEDGVEGGEDGVTLLPGIEELQPIVIESARRSRLGVVECIKVPPLNTIADEDLAERGKYTMHDIVSTTQIVPTPSSSASAGRLSSAE